MGVILWFAVRLLHILKPFVKIALIESLMEALMAAEEGTEEETTETAEA